MTARVKLSPHTHSGRLKEHEYTSYFGLALVLLVVGLILGVYTASAISPGPASGSIGLTGTVPANPPKVAPTITSPSNGQHFTSSPVAVSGSCPSGTIVEVFKSDIFAGSVPCGSNGAYSLSIDLLIGTNTLTARAYDALNQSSPNSSPISASYDILPAQAPGLALLTFGGSQLVLNTDAVFRGSFPGQTLSVPISILGGVSPYAINIQWGDSTNKIVPRSDSTTFTIDHAYQKPGTFQITIQASDSQGRIAFLSVAAIVNGQPAGAGTSGEGSATGNTSASTISQLLVLWPLYTASTAVVVSFWLGERREISLLRRQHAIITS